ncbi:MAG: CYTH domain-containing protein [Syntrophaceae bacterium]
MGLEIERKFLVRDPSWKDMPLESVEILQGYICSDTKRAVRVRTAGEKAWICVKSAVTSLRRAEFEYDIPLADARELLQICPLPPLEKIRHKLVHAGKIWVIDEYMGVNSGLIVAEIELQSEEEEFEKPPWAGEEVSDSPEYLSVCLYERPYSTWK